jgi:hypothetical protein
MKNGQNIVVQAINMKGTPISISLPLADFAKAYDGQATYQKLSSPSAPTNRQGLSREPNRADERRGEYNFQRPHWDPELEARSRQIFGGWASTEQQRLMWLQDQENLKADRERGKSYSVRVR